MCSVCGKRFTIDNKKNQRQKYCDKCDIEIKKQQNRERVKNIGIKCNAIKITLKHAWLSRF